MVITLRFVSHSNCSVWLTAFFNIIACYHNLLLYRYYTTILGLKSLFNKNTQSHYFHCTDCSVLQIFTLLFFTLLWVMFDISFTFENNTSTLGPSKYFCNVLIQFTWLSSKILIWSELHYTHMEDHVGKTSTLRGSEKLWKHWNLWELWSLKKEKSCDGT